MAQHWRAYRQQNPLAFRLMGAIVLVSSLITLVAVLLLLGREYRTGVSLLERQLDQVETSVLPGLSRALWNFDEAQLQAQLDALAQLPEVEIARLQWQHWDGGLRELVAGQPGDATTAALHEEALPLHYTRNDGSVEYLGDLALSLTHAPIHQRVAEHAVFIAVFQAMKTLLIAVIIIALMRFMLTRHLRRIAAYARGLGLQTLDTPLTLEREQGERDELQDIADALNHMRDSLRTDIARREETEQALRHEQQQRLAEQEKGIRAESANRAKSHFLATMSHEIRTPMNGIIGILDLLTSTQLDDRQKHYLHLMQHSSENLLAILNDILDYSKIEAGQLSLEQIPLDLQLLVEDAVTAFAGIARQQGLELVLDIQLRHARHVQGDPLRIRQILLNLINNALKFTRAGHVVVRVREDDDGQVRMDVEDSGIGIHADQLHSIFDAFTQADDSTSRRFGGSGLGLALCQRLAQEMDGRIEVHSRPGSGSCFTVTLPLPRELAPTDNRPEDTGTVLLLGPAGPAQKAVQGMLRFAGVNVTAASDPSHLDLGARYRHMLVDHVLYQKLDAPRHEQLSRYRDRVWLMAPLDMDTAPYRSLPRPVTASSLARLLDRHGGPSSEQARISEHNRFDHLSVLIAEDNDVNRDVILAILAALRIHPVVCVNGEEAVAAYRAAGGAFDLVLMDCEMPVMDGFAATRAIRQMEQDAGLPDVPVVALTAHVLEEQRQRMRDAGMNHFLSKPVRKDAVQKLLSELGLERTLQVMSFEQRNQDN
ncbi:MAG: hypothetical protein C0462_13160 [Alcanivorax sp.]|nr:hypothetical protein [Alcanivorax sp.]